MEMLISYKRPKGGEGCVAADLIAGAIDCSEPGQVDLLLRDGKTIRVVGNISAVVGMIQNAIAWKESRAIVAAAEIQAKMQGMAQNGVVQVRGGLPPDFLNQG